MGYRKIEVNGKTYEYVVGRSHVKVKGLGTWLKSHVGRVIDERTVEITPAHVRHLIDSAENAAGVAF